MGSVGNRVVISQAVVPPRSVQPIVLSASCSSSLVHLRRLPRLASTAPLRSPSGVACRVPRRAAIYLILSPLDRKEDERSGRAGLLRRETRRSAEGLVDDVRRERSMTRSRLSRDMEPRLLLYLSFSACRRSPMRRR